MGCRALLSPLVLCVTILSGCGGKSDNITVTGKISFDGAPVTSGVINFLATGGRPIGGGINPDGTYSFELPKGEYQVRIDAPAPVPEGWKEGQPLPKLGPRLVPEKYASYNSSGLTANITGKDDPQTIDFILP